MSGKPRPTCKYGHPWTEESTDIRRKKDGTVQRGCGTCRREKLGWTTERYCEQCGGRMPIKPAKKYCIECAPTSAAYGRIERYGVDQAMFDAMYFEQDGECAICHVNEATHVDHNHTTGAVRELLCHSCNAAIGLFLEEPQRLVSAVLYLMEHDD